MEKYAPHPQWIKSYGLDDTKDMYLQRDDTGKVTTIMECNNYEMKGLSASRCNMRWNLEPFMKVKIEAYFQRVHLKDWQLIRKNSEKLIKSFVVDPKKLQRIND